MLDPPRGQGFNNGPQHVELKADSAAITQGKGRGKDLCQRLSPPIHQRGEGEGAGTPRPEWRQEAAPCGSVLGLLSTRIAFLLKGHLPHGSSHCCSAAYWEGERASHQMTKKKRVKKRNKYWKALFWLLLSCGRTPVAPLCGSYNLCVLGLASLANGTGFLWLETKQPH